MKNKIKMKHVTIIMALLFCISLGQVVSAEVSPDDVIDQSNWQKIQGMVPEQILDFVKQGKMTNLKIGTLTYDPTDYHPALVNEYFEKNKGKYDVADGGLLVDKKTGKYPGHIMGWPFPGVNENTPDAAIKIAYNTRFYRQSVGNMRFGMATIWVGSGGYERSIIATLQEWKYTSSPQMKDIPNLKGFMRKSVYKILEPYDVSGTAVMLWSYRDLTEDQNFAYVPAIRRVRRTSPASRSDALFGSDFTNDDLACYEGKIPDLKWKLVGTCDEHLVPYICKYPIKVLRRPDGSYINTGDHPVPVYGYQVEGWEGAPWAPTNCIWVKRKMYLIEGHSKNPYYNYGKQLYWFDAATCIPVYKVVYDRTGKYWKTMVAIFTAVESKDKTWGHMEYAGSFIYDIRADHATITRGLEDKYRLEWRISDLNPNMFSLAGFARFCK